jgi:PqqD family protein of HPr-rel-A system
MAGPVYIAEPESEVHAVALDGLTLLFHAPSGMTHIVAAPAPEILDALRQGPADAAELLRRLRARFDFEPSPMMGEGRVGVNVSAGTEPVSQSTPPQPLPIEGRGEEIEALAARLGELEAAGLVRRA